MKTLIKSLATLTSTLLLSFASHVAQADGFVCESVDNNAFIRVFNASATNTSATDDRSPRANSLMLVDSLKAQATVIAKFSAASGFLKNNESQIVAHATPQSAISDAKIAGVHLSTIDSIILDIDFSYSESYQGGKVLSAQVIYTLKNGETLTQDFDCIHFADNNRVLSATSPILQ